MPPGLCRPAPDARPSELEGRHWLRLMYAYPSCFTDEMIRAHRGLRRVVKYIDMPLQHINDQMLTMMHAG